MWTDLATRLDRLLPAGLKPDPPVIGSPNVPSLVTCAPGQDKSPAEAERRPAVTSDELGKHELLDSHLRPIQSLEGSFEELKHRITVEVMPLLWTVIEDTKKKASVVPGNSNGVITQSCWRESPAGIGNMNDKQFHAAKPAAANESAASAGSSSFCCTPGRHKQKPFSVRPAAPQTALQPGPQTAPQIALQTAPTVPPRAELR